MRPAVSEGVSDCSCAQLGERVTLNHDVASGRTDASASAAMERRGRGV